MIAVRTFTHFITASEIDESPCGDFISDSQEAIYQRIFPDPKSWEQLEDFLHGRRACEAAIEAGRKVWEIYSRERAKP